MKRIFRTFFGVSNIRRLGYNRFARGYRHGSRRDLYWGVALAFIAWLGDSSGGKKLLFKKKVPAGSAIVIHHKHRGDPKVEVIKPESS